MLDVALFLSNATRLKAVLELGPSTSYYTTLVALLSISLLLQVVIGILLVVIGEKPPPGPAMGMGPGSGTPSWLPEPAPCTPFPTPEKKQSPLGPLELSAMGMRLA